VEGPKQQRHSGLYDTNGNGIIGDAGDTGQSVAAHSGVQVDLVNCSNLPRCWLRRQPIPAGSTSSRISIRRLLRQVPPGDCACQLLHHRHRNSPSRTKGRTMQWTAMPIRLPGLPLRNSERRRHQSNVTPVSSAGCAIQVDKKCLVVPPVTTAFVSPMLSYQLDNHDLERNGGY